MTTSKVWHHRPPHKVGQEVLDLYGQPGFQGWMTFIHQIHMMELVYGEWELEPDRIAARIAELAADIKGAGFLMLNAESPLDNHNNLPLFIELVHTIRNKLREQQLYPLLGVFRVPDHANHNAINRFAMIPTLLLTDAVYVMVKGTGNKWDAYLKHVVQVAPHHAHVFYIDAYYARGLRKGEPFTKKKVLTEVCFGLERLVSPQIVFRQEGPHVAQAIRWTLEYLGYPLSEEQTP